MKKLSKTEAELRKGVAYKRSVYNIALPPNKGQFKCTLHTAPKTTFPKSWNIMESSKILYKSSLYHLSGLKKDIPSSKSL